MTITAHFIIETHAEDDFEIIDFSIRMGDSAEPTPQPVFDYLDEMDVSRLVGVNPVTEMINAIDPGVYEYVATIDVDTDLVNPISSRKLSDEEVEKIFDNELPIPDAVL